MVAVDEGEGVRNGEADKDKSFDDADDRGGDDIAELRVREVFVVAEALV